MVGLRKDDVVQHLGRPAVVALVESCLRGGHRLVRAAGELDEPLRLLHRREWIEVRRIGVKPAKVER